MQFFVALQLNFLKKPGVPHENEMLFMEIGLSTYNYTQKICVEVRASWDRGPQIWDFFYFFLALGYDF